MIEVRTVALTADDVHYPQRTIELIAVPYDEWTPVEFEGRIIEESFHPGAFGNVQNRAHRFNVNLEHDRSRTVGRVTRLDPSYAKGLRAEVLIRRAQEFDDVLADAADGMLDASIGFSAYPENQEWEGKARRRILKAKLDHIALTFTPAYAGANVLDVRTAPAPSATPNLDRIRLAQLAQEYHLNP